VRAAWLLEDFVKNRILSLTSIATLAVVFGMISWGSAFAQTTPATAPEQQTPQTQPTPTPDTPPTQQTPQTQPAPTPEVPPATQQPPSSSTQTPSTQTPSTPAPSAQTPDQATQPPSSKDNNAPANSTPSATAPNAGASASGAATASDSQSFSGTVEKSGDKYVLKDDSGKTFDIDHQTDVSKFEGKRVRVQGKLDASGSKIMVK
jgi:outer membrane biosynthesis protein TonB